MKSIDPLLFFLLLLTTPVGWCASGLGDDLDFAHDVVPILRKHCARCHTNGTYKGGLSLDTRSALIRSGVVKVGTSSKSELIARISSTDEDERMPSEGSSLAQKEIETLKTWVDTGLAWQAGFTFKKKSWKAPISPRKPVIPADAGNPIDYLVNQYFLKNEIQWPAPVDDALFLRRISLDLTGLLPSRNSVVQFVENKTPGKRKSTITDTLSRNRDFADHWLTFWNDHLRNDYVGTGYIDGGRKQITAWLYKSLYQNKPYDQFARELIHPSPESEGFIKGIKWRGNVNASQVRELQFAQSVSQVFLGENLKCASCHDSFINDWKLVDAYGLASVVSDQPMQMYHCDKPTGQTAEIKFLWPELGKIDPAASKNERLKQTAQLITGQQNGRFTRTIVNRIWKRMMGRGLVEPVDVMGNRPWNEDVLDYLAVHLQENEYDLKKTMSLIANSRIYQSKTVPLQTIPDDNFLFTGPMVRRMTAEQFLDSVWQITGGAPRGKKGPIPTVATASSRNADPTSRPSSHWTWKTANSATAAGNESIEFKGNFNFPRKTKQALVVITCDNEYTIFVNQKKVKNDSDWLSVETIDISRFLKKGNNEIRVLGRNHTASPNPAGLYVSLFLEKKHHPLPLTYQEKGQWVPAKKVSNQGIWAAVKQEIIQRESMARNQSKPSKIRSALVVSDPLMRSLGRPNREQIVTSRDDQLSTLQALDLSNGELFTNILREGAKQLLAKQESPQVLIHGVFELALSRKPTDQEIKILSKIIGKKPSPESIADLLWSVVMLPEFQHVR